MLIDWFTVGAQVLNFLVLVWLMKRYLYQPILRAIDAREKRIAAELSAAERTRAEAQKERDEYQQHNESLDQQRAELLRTASDEARAEGQRLIDAARRAADALTEKRQNALKREQQRLKESIVRRTREEVFAIARKTLSDLADTTLEACMTAAFTRRLLALTGPAKESLATALKNSSDPAVVRSTFILPPAQRAAIQQALNEAFSADIRIDFAVAPDVISGIELTTGGQKVAWSVADYLAAMEQRVSELTQLPMKDEAIKEPTAPETRVAAAPETSGKPE